jgi:hypothetical protein
MIKVKTATILLSDFLFAQFTYVESIDKLIPLVSNFTNRLLVEVYDEKMVLRE